MVLLACAFLKTPTTIVWVPYGLIAVSFPVEGRILLRDRMPGADYRESHIRVKLPQSTVSDS